PIPLADQVGEGQATVLVLLRDRDHEAQVALHQLLHRLLVAGAHLPGERDFLLLSEEGRLRHLVEVLVEDVALVLMGAEAGEQTPTPPALRGGGGLRRGGGRDGAGGAGGVRGGGGGGTKNHTERLDWPTARGNSSVGRAQPCQGWGRGFESRFPLSMATRGGAVW